jgi:hypothetical protein
LANAEGKLSIRELLDHMVPEIERIALQWAALSDETEANLKSKN